MMMMISLIRFLRVAQAKRRHSTAILDDLKGAAFYATISRLPINRANFVESTVSMTLSTQARRLDQEFPIRTSERSGE